MRRFILVLVVATAALAGDGISYIKRGDFKYANEKLAVIPYECKDEVGALCDEIDDAFEDLLFEQFDTNYVVPKKVRKALKQARFKKLDAENMSAIANHLKVDYFIRLRLELAGESDIAERIDVSRLIKAEIELINPQTGNAVLQVDSEGRGTTAIRDRFQQLFNLGFR